VWCEATIASIAFGHQLTASGSVAITSSSRRSWVLLDHLSPAFIGEAGKGPQAALGIDEQLGRSRVW
jgi:hypothetical protein